MTTAVVDPGGAQPLRVRVAEEIRAWMGRRRITGVGLAKAMGKSQRYVSRRLTGEVAFDVDDLELIASVLGVPISGLGLDTPRERQAISQTTDTYSARDAVVLPFRRSAGVTSLGRTGAACAG